MANNGDNGDNGEYVSPYNVAVFPRWYWSLLLVLLFFAFMFGIYLMSKPKGSAPAVSLKQNLATGGTMGMTGAV